MYYCYTTLLGKSEEEFWNSTLKKVHKQLAIYAEVNSPKEGSDKPQNKGQKGGIQEVSGETIRLKSIE